MNTSKWTELLFWSDWTRISNAYEKYFLSAYELKCDFSATCSFRILLGKKSEHTGFCGQKRTFEVMMTKKTNGESDMNCYLRDRNENSGSIFNFAHFTSWYGLCQKSYLRTCHWKRGYNYANIFHLRRTSFSANIIDTNNSWKIYSVCMVCVDSVNVSSSDRFRLVYYNHFSSLTVSSTVFIF